MTRLAAELGISRVYLSQLAAAQDGRVPSVELSHLIEAKTGVRRWFLRPDDWHEKWPDLIGKKGAPKVPAEEVKGA